MRKTNSPGPMFAVVVVIVAIIVVLGFLVMMGHFDLGLPVFRWFWH